MKHRFPSIISVVAAMYIGLAASSFANADINGFGNFSGFKINQNDSDPAPSVSNGAIELTVAGGDDYRSIFDTTPQSISAFTATFDYRSPNAEIDQGTCFVIQNSAAGAAVVSGQGLFGIAIDAETFGFGGISNSAAISFELGDGTPSGSASGFYTDGNVNSNVGIGASHYTAPVNLWSNDPISATITYNGSVLSEKLVDTVTLATYSDSYPVDLPQVIGGSTAYVGFTAGTFEVPVIGGPYGQYVSDFQFTATSVPEPASLGLLGVGIVAVLSRRTRRRASR